MPEFICGILKHSFFHLLVFFLHVLSSLSTHQMLNARITNSVFSFRLLSFDRSLSIFCAVAASRTCTQTEINILRWQMHSIWDYLCSLLIILRLNYRAFFHFFFCSNVCLCAHVWAACQSKRAVAMVRTLASLHLLCAYTLWNIKTFLCVYIFLHIFFFYCLIEISLIAYFVD